MTKQQQADHIIRPYRQKIERLLVSCGASGMGYRWDGDCCYLSFELHGYVIIWRISHNFLEDFAFTDGGRARPHEVAMRLYRQDTTRVWEAIIALLDGKFRAIELGITTEQEEFWNWGYGKTKLLTHGAQPDVDESL